MRFPAFFGTGSVGAFQAVLRAGHTGLTRGGIAKPIEAAVLATTATAIVRAFPLAFTVRCTAHRLLRMANLARRAAIAKAVDAGCLALADSGLRTVFVLPALSAIVSTRIFSAFHAATARCAAFKVHAFLRGLAAVFATLVACWTLTNPDQLVTDFVRAANSTEAPLFTTI